MLDIESGMRDTLMSNYGGLGIILGFGLIVLVLFIVLRFFKTVFSLSFIGFLGSLFSYFVYDYVVAKIAVIACISFVFCLVGFNKTNIIGKIFSVMGVALSAYIIIHTIGII